MITQAQAFLEKHVTTPPRVPVHIVMGRAGFPGGGTRVARRNGTLPASTRCLRCAALL